MDVSVFSSALPLPLCVLQSCCMYTPCRLPSCVFLVHTGSGLLLCGSEEQMQVYSWVDQAVVPAQPSQLSPRLIPMSLDRFCFCSLPELPCFSLDHFLVGL